MKTDTRITTFVNLTPHRVSIILASGEQLDIEAQPEPARVGQSHTVITHSDDGDQSGRTVEIAAPTYGAIVGLPEPVPTVAYICSVFVAQAAAAAGRTDVLYPDSGPDATRKDGQVVAVKRLLAPAAVPAPIWPATLSDLNISAVHGAGEPPVREGLHHGMSGQSGLTFHLQSAYGIAAVRWDVRTYVDGTGRVASVDVVLDGLTWGRRWISTRSQEEHEAQALAAGGIALAARLQQSA